MVQLVEILPCEDKVTCILYDPNHSCWCSGYHYIDVIMTTMASQITSLLNRLFWRRSKKTSKLRVTGLCAGNSPGPVNSPHKGPVTRNIFPFDDVIMTLFTPQPSGLEGYCRHGPGGRAGGRADWRAGGWAGGCQTCGTHISVTAWWIFSVQSSMELSRPVVVHCHAHMPICPIWACPWAKNLSNLPQIGSRLCGSHISETTGWINPI